MKKNVIASLFNVVSAKEGKKNDKAKPPRRARLWLENLETRELLSVSPLATFAALADSNADAAPLCALEIDDGAFSSGELLGALDNVEELSANAGATYTVTSLSDSISDVGSLRYALSVAQDGDTIFFADSLRGGTITLGGTQLEITKSITIDASNLWDVDAQAPGITIDANRLSSVFYTAASAAEFNGLAIVNGMTSGEGGGVYLYGGGTFTNCSISGNSADNGGGVYVSGGGNGTFTNCTISGNSANNNGGVGVEGDATFTNSAISGNNASESVGGVGVEGDATFTDCAISGNNASDSVGGIGVYGGATFTDCAISGNGAGNVGGIGVYGVGIFINCAISGNEVEYGVGGVGVYGDGTFTNCAISGNVANYVGGGIGVSGEGTFTNCAISENNSGYLGGGVYINSGEVAFTNCTVSGNTASYNGGGVYVDSGSTTFNNSIIARNTSVDIYGSAAGYNTLSSYVDWSNASESGVVNYEYDPSLPLFSDAANGDYRLAAGSQAINKGDNARVAVESDLDGNERVFGEFVDLGAYEYRYQEESILVTTLADVVDPTDGLVSLREAINNASDGDTVLFADELAGGTITLGGTQLEITKSITIDASNLWNADAQAPGITISGNNSSRVFYVASVDVALDGLAIVNGAGDSFGGGALVHSANVAFTKCVIGGNSALNDGGGVYIDNGSATFTDCEINGNASETGFGGGVYAYHSSATFTDCMIGGNSADYDGGTDGGAGGGVNLYYSEGAFTNCTIAENTAQHGAGVAVGFDGYGTFTNCAITGNDAVASGGGITFGNSRGGSFTNCEIVDNSTYGSGGGCEIFDAEVEFINCAISSNNGIGSGGGAGVFFSGNGTGNFTNCAITANVGTGSTYGGGVCFFDAGSGTFTNCTIAGNSAILAGGACFFGGQATFINSIVALNGSDDIVKESDSTVVGINALSTYADWDESESCYVYSPDEPLFTNADESDYTLAPGSQAIDRGDNERVETENDLAGRARISGGIVDLGAYEYRNQEESTVVTTLDDVVDPTDGLVSLREAINYAADGDTVLFADELAGGTITLGGTQLEITKSITIDATNLWSEDEQAPGITIDGNQESRVFYAENVDVAFVGLKIANGKTADYSSNYYDPYELAGGGVHFSGGTNTFTNCTIVGNSGYYGGGVDARGEATFVNCAIIGNTSYLGSGVDVEGVATFVGCVVKNNINTVDGEYTGGVAIYGNATFTDCAVDENSAGSGVYVRGEATFANCAITRNSCFEDGGVRVDGFASFTDCKISDNNGFYGGGASIYGEGVFENCVISGNLDACRAGGVFISYGYDYGDDGYDDYIAGHGLFVNCAIIGNNSENAYYSDNFYAAGGIYVSGLLESINCTISGNSSEGGFGGVVFDYNLNEDYDSPSLGYFYNSVIAENIGGDISTYYVYSDSEEEFPTGIAYGYNSLSTFVDWENQEETDVVNYAYDSTLPLFTNASAGDYTLAAGSQAVNRGENEHVEVEYDLAGNPRIMGGVVDLGAYESYASLVVTTLSDIVDPYDELTSLREAISYATNGDTVTFDDALAGGTITLDGTQLTIKKSITIDASNLRPASSSAPGVTVSGAQSSRVFYVDRADVSFVGLAIVDGRVESSDLSGYGGGIYARNGAVSFIDCSITGCDADYGGGAFLWNAGGAFVNCSIMENSAKNGGGIDVYNRSVATFTNGVLSGNVALEGYGGGAYVGAKGAATFIESAIAENSADYSGGGVYVQGGTADFIAVSLTGNSAVKSGAGAYVGTDASATFTDGAISGNVAGSYGGGAHVVGRVAMTNVSISENAAKYGAGAYVAAGGEGEFANVAITENVASANGGGVYLFEGTGIFTNCTIAGNAASKGSGAYVNSNGVGEFYNTIVALNKSSDLVKTTSGAVYGYNALSSYTAWTESDACLRYDAEKPLFVDADAGNYALVEDSQAIDAGASGYATTSDDLAGYPRIVGASVDLGAYEYQGEPTRLAAPDATAKTTASTITLTWNAVPYASGYEIVFNGATVSVGAKETSRVFTGLKSSTSYEFALRALGDGSVFLNSEEVALVAKTTAFERLDRPVVAAIAKGVDSIDVSWDVVPNASSYTLSYAVKAATPVYTEIELGAETSRYSIAQLAANTNYYVKVRANGDGVEYASSPQSATVAVKTKSILAAPTITETTATASTISLRWQGVSHAVGYEVLCDGQTVASVDALKKSATIAGLAPNARYELRVRALGDGVDYFDSADATVVVKTTALVQLARPVVAATSDGVDTIDVSWDAVPNATSYTLSYALKAATPEYAEIQLDAGATRHVLSGLTAGKNYYVKVRANGDAVEYANSPQSATATVKTKSILAAPTITEPTATASTISLRWQGVSHAVGYEILLDGQRVAEPGANERSATITGLAPNTRHALQIKALGDGVDYFDSPNVALAVRTTALVQLERPVVSVVATSADSLAVVWRDVPNATSYTLSYAVKSSAPNYTEILLDANTTEFVVGKLAANTTYYVKVRANGDNVEYANSPQSATQTARTDAAFSNATLETATLEEDEFDFDEILAIHLLETAYDA